MYPVGLNVGPQGKLQAPFEGQNGTYLFSSREKHIYIPFFGKCDSTLGNSVVTRKTAMIGL